MTLNDPIGEAERIRLPSLLAFWYAHVPMQTRSKRAPTIRGAARLLSPPVPNMSLLTT
jgi:hypothetical protein